MSWIDDVVANGIEKVATKGLEEKAEQMLYQILKEKIDQTFTNTIQEYVKDVAKARIDKLLSGMDEALSVFQGLDKQMKIVVKDADKTIKTKLGQVMEKLEFNVKITPEMNQLLDKAMNAYLLNIFNSSTGQNLFIPIIREKIKAKIQTMNLS